MDGIKPQDGSEDVDTPFKNKRLLGPRTPTPFKNALAKMRGKNDVYIPPSPARICDLEEIIHKERQKGEITQDSVYDTDTSAINATQQTIKREADGDEQQVQVKKAKKSLVSSWDNASSSHMPFAAETPVLIIVFIFYINYIYNSISFYHYRVNQSCPNQVACFPHQAF